MWRYNNTGEAISFLHTKNIRIHFPITKLVTDALYDPLYRYQLITTWIEMVNDYCYDGISFDVELPMYANSTKDSYALLVEETRHALDKIDENLEISMAVPFTPEPLGCISGRCKRWRRMSKVVNQVFIMGYDSQDNILVGKLVLYTQVPYIFFSDTFITTQHDKRWSTGLLRSWHSCIETCSWYSLDGICLSLYFHRQQFKSNSTVLCKLYCKLMEVTT